MCTPALQDAQGNWATTMEGKEAMIRAKAFPSPPQSVGPEVRPEPGNTHLRITSEEVREALFNQSIRKTPGPTKLNFRAIRLLWSWEEQRIIDVVKHSLRLRHHPKRWKLTRGVLLHKSGKPKDQVKSYRVIYLLECMGKVLEKVVVNELLRLCEERSLLHLG